MVKSQARYVKSAVLEKVSFSGFTVGWESGTIPKVVQPPDQWHQPNKYRKILQELNEPI